MKATRSLPSRSVSLMKYRPFPRQPITFLNFVFLFCVGYPDPDNHDKVVVKILTVSLGLFLKADFMGVLVLVLSSPAQKEMVRLLPSSSSVIPASFLALSAFSLRRHQTLAGPEPFLLNLCHHVALRQVLLVLARVRQEIAEGLLHPGAFCVLVLP